MEPIALTPVENRNQGAWRTLGVNTNCVCTQERMIVWFWIAFGFEEKREVLASESSLGFPNRRFAGFRAPVVRWFSRTAGSVFFRKERLQ